MSDPAGPDWRTPAPLLVRIDACGRTEIGPNRTQNQDAIVVAGCVGIASGARLIWRGEITGPGVLVAVVDGMGGHTGGAEAAGLIATALAQADVGAIGDRWDDWFEALSRKVAQAGSVWGTADMGATVAVLGVTPDGLVMTNVGDCRIYRLAGGRLGQLSVDDRTATPGSSAVTQALGGSIRTDSHLWRQPFAGGQERYLLCSDGVWETLGAATLRDICAAERPAADVAEDLARAIYTFGGGDNGSAVVVDIAATPLEPAAEPLRTGLANGAPPSGGRGRGWS